MFGLHPQSMLLLLRLMVLLFEESLMMSLLMASLLILLFEVCLLMLLFVAYLMSQE